MAASIARWGLDNRYSVGFLTNGVSPLTDEAIRVPFSRAPGQLAAVLEALALVGPISRQSIFELLVGESHRLPLGSTVALVTATIDDSAAEAIRELRRAGLQMTVIWVGDGPMPIALGDVVPVFEVGETLARAEREEQFRQPEWTAPVGAR